MRSIFSWMMFCGVEPTPQEIRGGDDRMYTVLRYPLPGNFRTAVSLVIFSAVLLLVAHVWTGRMEPKFAWVTRKAEETMSGKGETEPGSGALRPMLPVRKE